MDRSQLVVPTGLETVTRSGRTRSQTGGRLALLFACSFLSACHPPIKTLESVPSGEESAAWEDWFGDEEELDLARPPNGPALMQINELAVSSDGGFILPDGAGKRLLHYRADGSLERAIPLGDGTAIGLTVLRTVAFDPDGDLVLFDPGENRVTVLALHEESIRHRYSIPTRAAALLPLADGSLVTYSPSESRVFQRFDREGARTDRAHRIDDEDSRIFHARIQNGGITRTPEGEIFGIHPAAYEIVRLTADLDIVEIWRSTEGDPYQPHPRKLPDRLSPYEYTPLHEEWWSGFDHVAGIFALLGDHLIVTVSRGKPREGNLQSINIYRADGTVRALGLPVPNGGRLVAARGREVFVARNARLRDDGDTEPSALWRYRVRQNAP